jgi:hypothetical protein
MRSAEDSLHNLRLAVIGCVVVSMICALTVYLTADFILASFRSTDALVMLITDAGIRIDRKHRGERSRLNTLVHEALHIGDMEISEAKVRHLTAVVVEALWRQNYRRVRE